MKATVKIIPLFVLLLCANGTQAQFLKKLQKKIENKLERRLEKKAEDRADQAMDSVLERKVTKRRKKRNNDTSRDTDSETSEEVEIGGIRLGEMMEAAMNRKPGEYDLSYTFILTTKMEITTQDHKPMVMTTSYGDGAHYTDMGNGTTIINDYKNASLITLNTDKMTGQAMSTDIMKLFDKTTEETNDVSDTDISIHKTGKTRTINGYLCKEYIINGEDFKTEGWFTTEITFDMVAHAKSMSDVFKSASGSAMMSNEMGYPMEMITTTTKNEKVKMTVLEIDENSKEINLNGYTITQL